MKQGQTDFLDLMEPDEPVEATPAPTPEPTADTPQAATEPQGQPRTPDGKFAEKPKQDEAQQGVKPEAQPAPATEPPAVDTSPTVPRAALEDERKKRQALEAELAKLKPPAPAAQTPKPAPPKGPEFSTPQVDYEQDPQAAFQAEVHSIRMGTSWEFAVMQSSEAEVTEAWAAFDEACKNDPQVNAWSFSPELKNHRHPFGEVLKWHRKQKQLARLNEIGDLDAYIAAEVAKATANGGAQPAPAAAAPAARPAPNAPPPPPPSLARGGNGQGDAPDLPSEDEDFKGFFAELKQPRKKP